MDRARTLTLEDSDGETSVWVHADDYDRAVNQKTELERLLEERLFTLKARLSLLQKENGRLGEQIADLQDDLRESHERRRDLEETLRGMVADE